jgi:multidrug efflux pump
MALTIATGFVVDDAIVVMENITRHSKAAWSRCRRAEGRQEIGFTVFSISMSLIAVFIPILMMGGIIGRLFREFAVTLSTAIVVSMVISLTTTPMMCAHLLKAQGGREAQLVLPNQRKFFNGMLWIYRHSLAGCWTIRADADRASAHHCAERSGGIDQDSQGVLPAAGHGRDHGRVQGPQDASFPFMNFSISAGQRHQGRSGRGPRSGLHGGGGNGGFMFIALKPLGTNARRRPQGQCAKTARRT